MEVDHRSTYWDLDRTRAGAVRITSPAPRDVWNELLREDREALVFQSPAWVDTLSAAQGYRDVSRLYEFSNGRKLLLPLVRRPGLPAAIAVQASMPHSWGMGGLIAPGGLFSEEVLAVIDDLSRLGSLQTTIRPNPLFAVPWQAATAAGVVSTPMVAHILDLEGGFDNVWSKRFTSETRTSVRKAERSGLVVECDSTGRLVPAFYQLFMQSVQRWAGMQHEPLSLSRWRARRRDPISKFEHMARVLGDRFRVWVAWLDERPVASLIVLQGANASYTRGAMDKELAGPTRANQLLHRMAIEDACLSGCRRYHMGESGTSTSLAQFKSRLGAVAYPYAQYTVERLPFTNFDRGVRRVIKSLIGFKDAQ